MKYYINSDSDEKNENILSIIVSIYASIPIINQIIIAIFPNNSIMGLLYICTFFLLLIYCITNHKKIKIKIIHIYIAIVILVLFVISKYIVNVSELTLYELFVYVLIPIFILSIGDINGKVVIKSNIVLATLGNLFGDKLFKLDYNSAITMGISYVILLPTISSIIYLIKIRDNKIFTVLSIINLLYLYQIMAHGSRGTVLSIIILMIFLLLFENSENKGIKAKFKYSTVLLLAIVILVLVFNYLITSDRSVLLKMPFFEKMDRLSQNGDVTNGRAEIYNIAFVDILNNPIMGYGISSFNYYNNGLSYPHNFIVQFIYDTGIIGTSIFLFPILKGLLKWKKECDYNDYLLLMLFFCSSVPGALFSNDLWKNVLLWMFFALTVRKIKRKEG